MPALLGGRYAPLGALLALSVVAGINDEVFKNRDHEWDVLIFTQHWPLTVCLEWKDKAPSHTCKFPSQTIGWTVHGVWPTKLNTMGPNFCNSTIKFRINAVADIKTQMEQYWTNIESDTPLYSLWEHEWSKHGTCAMSLPALDTELKYFAQGLRWLQLYSMSELLAKANVLPNDSAVLNSEEVYQAVRGALGKNPSLHCVDAPHSPGVMYLFEIRICFDKGLELIDCDGTKVESDPGLELEEAVGKSPLNHCDVAKALVYPSAMPKEYATSSRWELPLIEIYKTVQWLRWYTL